MKDAIHHLKHTQKKVIQSARKAGMQEQEQEMVKTSIASNNGNYSKNVKKDSSY
ncbi:MAG: hypothetical protein H0T62_08940 [Parachlamydiaceae bacterium]|nr:hypothetical protein [Parachlamydiaceae bacterium]